MDVSVVSINIIEEISVVFFWIGANGIVDRMISCPFLKQSKIYIYIFLLLLAIFIKIPNSS